MSAVERTDEEVEERRNQRGGGVDGCREGQIC